MLVEGKMLVLMRHSRSWFHGPEVLNFDQKQPAFSKTQNAHAGHQVAIARANLVLRSGFSIALNHDRVWF